MWKRRTFIIIICIYLAIVLLLFLSTVNSTQAQPNYPCPIDAQRFAGRCMINQ